MEYAAITPVFKNVFMKILKKASILPVIWKIFDAIISKQLRTFMDPLSSEYQCGFSKGFSAHNFVLVILEEIIGKLYYVLLTNLAKAFVVSPMN